MPLARSIRKPDVTKLRNDPRYRQVHELDFQDMIPFVLENIRKKGIISFLYLFLNLASLAFIILYAAWGLTGSRFGWSTLILQSLGGIIAGSILIIPIHELLHGLAYRILGARKIKFGADFQQFIFFVTADRYPVSKHELYFLAMTPFVIINMATLLIFWSWLPQGIPFLGLLLLSHNIMCIGDFAIVNYASQNPNRIYTFDETEQKKSYFFEEVNLKPE